MTSVHPSSVMHWKMVRNACGIELNVVIPKLKSSEYVSNSIVFFASSARPPAPGMWKRSRRRRSRPRGSASCRARRSAARTTTRCPRRAQPIAWPELQQWNAPSPLLAGSSSLPYMGSSSVHRRGMSPYGARPRAASSTPRARATRSSPLGLVTANQPAPGSAAKLSASRQRKSPASTASSASLRPVRLLERGVVPRDGPRRRAAAVLLLAREELHAEDAKDEEDEREQQQHRADSCGSAPIMLTTSAESRGELLSERSGRSTRSTRRPLISGRRQVEQREVLGAPLVTITKSRQ